MSLKKTFKSLFVLGIMKGAEFLIPLITFPHLAKYLEPKALGIYVLLQTIYGIVAVITDYGYITYGTKEVSQNSDNRLKLSEIVSRSVFTRLMFMFISVLAGCLVFRLLLGDQATLYMLMTIFVFGLLSSLNLIWLFQGLEIISKYATVFSISRLLTLPLTLLLVKNPADLSVAIVISLFPVITITTFCIFFVFRVLKLNIMAVTSLSLKHEVSIGWHYFLPNFYSILFTNLGIIALGATQTPATVGGYGAVERLVKAISSICGIINQVVYPQVASVASTSVDRAKRLIVFYMKVFVPLLLFITLLMVFFGDSVVHWLYGEKYIKYSVVNRYLPFYIFLAGINTFIGVIYMTIFGHQSVYSKIFLLGTVVAISLYFLLPYYVGFHAPAVGLVVGELVITALISIFIWRRYEKRNT